MRQMRIVTVLILALSAAACARPPQEQILEARQELQTAANSADVLTYAPDSLRAAQETMAVLEQSLAAQAKRFALGRSYDDAKSLALQVLAESRTAVKNAGRAKQQVREETGPLIETTLASAAEVEKRLWSARRVRGVPAEFLATGARDIASARTSLADAQKDFDSGAFASAKAKAMAVRAGLEALDGRISEAVRLARK